MEHLEFHNIVIYSKEFYDLMYRMPSMDQYQSDRKFIFSIEELTRSYISNIAM